MANRQWQSNRIQFPRLLAEIRAVGLTETQYSDLQASMDLTREEIDLLLERAEDVWQGRKSAVAARQAARC